MPEQRLNQVIAVERTLKTSVEKDVTAAYHTLQKPALFEGMNRIYRPLVDDPGARLPPENKKVQQSASDLLGEATLRLSELMNTTWQKDTGNQKAKADVVVDGKPVLTNVPAPFLLFLEKKLVDVQTMISKLPTLDPSENWKLDTADKLWKTEVLKKIKTGKVPKVIVKQAPTPEHAGQADLIYEDVVIGNWDEQRVSSAYPPAEQKRLLQRVEKLREAVKRAIQSANQTEVADDAYPGAAVFEWLFQ
jgi:hypothetical protein